MESRLTFADLTFQETHEKKVKVNFINNYYFYLDGSELSDISSYKLDGNTIVFSCAEKRARNKFNLLLNKGFQGLHHKVRNKKTIYIHKNSGIPLIGSNEFGVVDRGSNIIEVKPLTGCNLSCVFCSVFEGKNDKKDLVVEEEYLVEEFRKLAAIKKHPVEANIGPQGEPLLYPKLIELIRDLKSTPNVDVISINTNGLTLNPAFIDRLAEAGLTRINLSLHALDKKLASELADGPYNLDQILKAIKACEGKIDVLLAPVLIPGKNEQELDGIIELSKTIKNKKYPTIGVQNYLNYKGGRNITEQMPWENFYELLKQKEKQHDVRLIMTENIFNILPDETLPKPFKKGQVIEVEIKSPGRSKNETIAAASDRAVTVLNCPKDHGKIKVRLLRDKHNIYTAVPA